MGSYFSLDSFFNSRRSAANVTPPKISSYATAAWVLQFFFIYFSGGITKNPEHWFWYPHAVHRLLSGSKFPTEIGALLANYPNISACLTVTTYLMEIAVPFLLFIPDPGGRPRTIFSLLFILFHFGLALTMKLNAFPFVCMALLPSLFPWSLSVFRRSNEGTDERGAKEQVVVVPPNILQRFIALTIVFMVIANIRTILGDTSPYEFGTPGWFFSRVLGLSQHWVMFNIVSG